MAKQFGMISPVVFLVGFFGAVIFGLLEGLNILTFSWLTLVLVIAGILVGALNITLKESTPLMLAVLVLAGAAYVLSVIPGIGTVLGVIFSKIAMFSAAAGVVVALGVVYKVTQ